MALHGYSEEELLAKKYNELFKISKNYGIKTSKRLKTDKLIEAILKYQQEEAALSLSQDAEAVMSALDGATHTPKDANSVVSALEGATHTPKDANTAMSALEGATHTPKDANTAMSALDGATHTPEEEELLLDIEFPDFGSKDFLECNSDSATDTSVEAVIEEQGQQQQTHKRSGTYEVEEGGKEGGDNEDRKVKRTSTFDYATSNDVTLPIDEKQTEENSKQISALADKVTIRGSRRNRVLPKPSLTQHVPKTKATGGSSVKPATKEGLSLSSKRRRSQTEPVPKEARPSSPWQSRLSISSSAKRQRRSVTVTPSAPAPALRPSLQQRRSRGTPATLTKPTTTTTATASIAKPVFTIGCGDKKEGTEGTQGAQDKGTTTGIPRFMSYARRLKVPNFARIHEQAFQRMDSLDDYVGKRRARHDTIGSTTKKKQDKAEFFQPSVTTVKNLNFNFTEESSMKSENEAKTSQPATINKASDNTQALDTVPRSVKKPTNTPGSTRLSTRVTREAIKPTKITSTKKEPTRKSPRLSRKPSPKSTHKPSPKQSTKVPLKIVQENKKVSPKLSRKPSPKSTHKPSPKQSTKLPLKTVQENKKVSPKASPKADVLNTTGHKPRTGQRVKFSPKPVSTKKVSALTFPAFGSYLKENNNPVKQPASSPTASKLPVPVDIASPASVRKRMQNYSKSLAGAGSSYVPYKGAVKPLKTRDNLKNLAQRKHNVKSSKQIREGQKNILKGVRLNKRFELQMANRGITM